jgi:hypothetical protein
MVNSKCPPDQFHGSLRFWCGHVMPLGRPGPRAGRSQPISTLPAEHAVLTWQRTSRFPLSPQSSAGSMVALCEGPHVASRCSLPAIMDGSQANRGGSRRSVRVRYLDCVSDNAYADRRFRHSGRSFSTRALCCVDHGPPSLPWTFKSCRSRLVSRLSTALQCRATALALRLPRDPSRDSW